MNPVIGVDCSTKRLAFVILDGPKGPVETFLVEAPKGKGWQLRLLALADEARHFFAQYNLCSVYVEEAPLGRGFRATLEVGYVVAATLVEAMRAGHIVMPVNVSTWKKQVLGNGRADKDQIREWATEFIFKPAGIEPPKEQDLHDAACIAAFARANLRGVE